MSGKMKTVAVLTNENAILRRQLADMKRERDEALEQVEFLGNVRGAQEDMIKKLLKLGRDFKRERDEARKWACHLYSALTDICDLAFDYDGYRTALRLMDLIDEIREIAGRAQVGK